MGRFVPDETALGRGEDIEYYDGEFLYLYSPIDSRIIIQKKDSASGTKISSYTYDFISQPRSAYNILQNPNAKITPTRKGISILLDSNGAKCEALVNSQNFLLMYQKINFNEVITETTWSDFILQSTICVPMRSETHIYGNKDKADIFVFRKILNIEFGLSFIKSDFIPSDFPLCIVQDEQFSPPLLYMAKGMLPSEEKVIAMASNKKLLEEHNMLIKKLGR